MTAVAVTTTDWQSLPTTFGYRYIRAIVQPTWAALLGEKTVPVWAFSAKQCDDVFVGFGLHRSFLPSELDFSKTSDPLFLQMAYESESGPSAILPRGLVHISKTGSTLTLYSDTPLTDMDCVSQYQALFHNNVDPAMSLSDRVDSPTFSEWQSAVSATQAEIALGQLKKVVLSRKSAFKRLASSDGTGLYTAFGERLSDASSYHYFYRDAESMIMGHSPEALFRAQGTHVSVDVVAGTRASDSKESLLDSAKDMAEHDIVLEYIRDILSPYGVVKKTTRTELSLGTLTHLHQCLSASIPKMYWGEIITALHPTPAICGAPKASANYLIGTLEKIPRGWYGGVFGMFTDNTIDLAVAIRGVQLTANTCVSHVGAGIVSASDPLQEWDELNRKLDSVIGGFIHPLYIGKRR